MRKFWALAAAILLGVFFAAQSARAADLSALPQNLQDIITNLLDTRFPPELQSITLAPAEPVAGTPTKVTITIMNDASVTSDVVTQLNFFYMVNFDGNWLPLEMTSDDNKTFTGDLPAFQKDDEIIYSVRAMDSSTNVFTSVPCKVGEVENVAAKDYLMGTKHLNDCMAANPDMSACEDVKPHECLMSMSQTDENVKKDTSKNVPPGSNIVDYRIGYDDANIYMDLTMQDKVADGTTNPMDIRGYVGLILNPEKLGKIKDVDGLLNAGGGAVLLFAPMAAIAGGMIKTCSLIYYKGNNTVMDENSITCKKKANHLLFTLARKTIPGAIGVSKSGVYHFLVVDAAITSITTPINGVLYDYSHITAAQFTDQPYFQVK